MAIGALALAIVTRRPEFAGLAAPPLVLLATWRTDRPAELSLGIDGPHGRIVERDEVAVTVSLAGQGDHDAELTLLPAAEVFAGPMVAVPADPERRPATVRLRFRAARWGRRRPGTLEIVLRDRARLAEGTVLVELARVDCAPLAATLDGSILLSRLQSRLGEHPARTAGDGGEFDGVREFVPGDRQRRINWAATTRRGTLHLTTFAAERTQNVVVIADVSFDIGAPGHEHARPGPARCRRGHRPLHREPGPDRPRQFRQRRRLDCAGSGTTAPGAADGAARRRPVRQPAGHAVARCPGPRCRQARSSSLSARCSIRGSSRRCATCASAASAC